MTENTKRKKTDAETTRDKIVWSAALSMCLWEYGRREQERNNGELVETFAFGVDTCLDDAKSVRDDISRVSMTPQWRMRGAWNLSDEMLDEKTAHELFEEASEAQKAVKRGKREVSIDNFEDDATTAADRWATAETPTAAPQDATRARKQSDKRRNGFDSDVNRRMKEMPHVVRQDARVRLLNSEEEKSLKIRMPYIAAEKEGVVGFTAYAIALAEEETNDSLEEAVNDKVYGRVMELHNNLQDDKGCDAGNTDAAVSAPWDAFIDCAALKKIIDKGDKTLDALLNGAFQDKDTKWVVMYVSQPFSMPQRGAKYKLVSGVVETVQGMDAFVVKNKFISTSRGFFVFGLQNTAVSLALYKKIEE